MLGRQGGEKGVEGHSRERSCHPIDLHSGMVFFFWLLGVFWFVGFVFLVLVLVFFFKVQPF